MALDWQNLAYYPTNNHNSYPLHCHAETDLLCFDTLFDINDFLVDPFPPHIDHLDHLYQTDHIQSNMCDFDTTLMIPCMDYFPPPPVYLPTEEYFPCEDDYYLCYNKRQKLISSCNGFMSDYYYHQVQHHENISNNCNDHNGGCNNVGVSVKAKSVTAQSKAARERRRKITEKTQELGKLVPGGTKMNTAEMFAAAFKYVKFLQAQLGVLQSMKSINEEDENTIKHNEHLSILASDVIQEKLYTTEKCLVPIDLLGMIDQHLDVKTDIIQ